jgi:hypothetical protein
MFVLSEDRLSRLLVLRTKSYSQEEFVADADALFAEQRAADEAERPPARYSKPLGEGVDQWEQVEGTSIRTRDGKFVDHDGAPCADPSGPYAGASVWTGFAAQIVATMAERGSNYDSPRNNFSNIASLWSNWLSKRLGQSVVFSAEDVAIFNILQKLSRLTYKTHNDSLLDIAGYVETIATLPASMRNTK